MLADRAWVQRNLGFDPIATPAPSSTFAFTRAAHPRSAVEDLQREIIDFDSEAPAGREFLAFTTATGLSRFTDIPWPTGLAPKTGAKASGSGRGALPKVDVLDYQGGTSHPLQDVGYAYDVFDRRVLKILKTYSYVDGAEGGTTMITTTTNQDFVYDGDHVVLDFSGNGTYSSSSPTTRYLYGTAVDQVFAQENTNALWFMKDNQGSTQYLVNSVNGLALSHYVYDAFGRVTSGDTSLTRYLYTGRELDTNTRLQYNRERWYDSNTGRWITQDPIGFQGDT
jgi:RHS repeat-associated protein